MPESSRIDEVPEQVSPLAEGRQPRRLAGTLLSAAGLAGLGFLTTRPRTAQASFLAGAAPDGGDLVNTSLTVQGDVTINGTQLTVNSNVLCARGNSVGIGSTSPTSSINPTASRFLDMKAPGLIGLVMHPIWGTQEIAFTSDGQGSGLRIDAAGAGTAAWNYIAFRTAPAASSYAVTERLRIDSNGNVGIGTASPVTKLEVAGPIAVNGTISTDASGVATKSYYAP